MSYCNCCGAKSLEEQHDRECIYHGAHDNLKPSRLVKWPNGTIVAGFSVEEVDNNESSFIPKRT